MPKPYAAATRVTAESTVQQLDRLLAQHGAKDFAYGRREGGAAVQFILNGLLIRLSLRLPPENDPHLLDRGRAMARQGRQSLPTSRQAAYKMIERQKWRALYLNVQAKLVAITEEIRTIESEFGMDVVMHDGRTVAEWITPQLAALYEKHGALPVLPGLEE